MVNDSGMNNEMEYLLTADAYYAWIDNYANQAKINKAIYDALTQLYFKEYGLPLDSEIRG
jgi:hypothetical protein